MINTGTLFAGRYVLNRKIGSGGMADVYEAQDTEREMLVALKVLKSDLSGDESFVRRFKKEGEAASSLSNPNIVSVYEVGCSGGFYYIAMELLDGITLKEYVRRKRVLTARETMAISAQIAVGLRAAHAKHIIHRDVKPQNVMLSRDGKVKVTDFGIASLNTGETKTMNNNSMGSVQYISPEQARGNVCDERSDIYSLGICMYEMITGQVPFDKDTSVAVAIAHMSENMVPPSKLNSACPLALEQIIFRCTQKTKDRRYHNCTELLKDLRIAVSSPDYNFEKQEQNDLLKSDTQVFSAEETEMIRRLSDKGEKAENASPAGRSAAAGSASDEPRSSSADANRDKKKQVLFEEDMREDSRSVFDRIITVLGVFLGAAMVCMIIYITGSLSGWFQSSHSSSSATSGSRKTEQNTSGDESESVSQASEETLETFDPNHYDPETQTLVPNVVGLGITSAIQLLKDNDLEYRVSSNIVYSDVYKVGTICLQNYAEGTVVLKGSTIVLTLSAGTDKFEIRSDYVGGSVAAFRNDVSKFADVIEVEYVKVNSDTVPANTIISLSPSSGIVSAGEKIVVTYSGGPAYIAVPDLLGMSRAEAISLLANQGLSVGSVTFDYSLEYEEGKVMEQQYEAGTSLANGSTVDIVVSNGPKIQTVPDLLHYTDEDGNSVIMTETLAREILEEMNFVVEIVEVLDEEKEDGLVISQDPAADSDLAEGETVTITVSRQEIIREVPDVVNQTDENGEPYAVTLEEATALLNAQGFMNIEQIMKHTEDETLNNVVYNQTPDPGTMLSIQESVTIWVYTTDEVEESDESTEHRWPGEMDESDTADTDDDSSETQEGDSSQEGSSGDPSETESSDDSESSDTASSDDNQDDPAPEDWNPFRDIWPDL